MHIASLYCHMYCPMYAPAAMVHELPQKLDWRLGTVRLELRCRAGTEAGLGERRGGGIRGGHTLIIHPSMELQVGRQAPRSHHAAGPFQPSSPRCNSSPCPIHPHRGHVEVIDEDDGLLAGGGTEHTLAPTIELGVNEVLRGGGGVAGMGDSVNEVGGTEHAHAAPHLHHEPLPQLSPSPASCWP